MGISSDFLSATSYYLNSYDLITHRHLRHGGLDHHGFLQGGGFGANFGDELMGLNHLVQCLGNPLIEAFAFRGSPGRNFSM